MEGEDEEWPGRPVYNISGSVFLPTIIANQAHS